MFRKKFEKMDWTIWRVRRNKDNNQKTKSYKITKEQVKYALQKLKENEQITMEKLHKNIIIFTIFGAHKNPQTYYKTHLNKYHFIYSSYYIQNNNQLIYNFCLLVIENNLLKTLLIYINLCLYYFTIKFAFFNVKKI